jgi:hypothetical protein
MDDWTAIARSALISGSVASAVATAALIAMSKLEGKTAVQPVNATSHWLHGSGAGAVRQLDVRHTLLGYVTNHAAAVFWALLFERLRPRRPGDDLLDTAKAAACVSAVAAVVDYGLVPRRLTPGWELALSKRSVAAGFLALAAGLTLGGLLSARAG